MLVTFYQTALNCKVGDVLILNFFGKECILNHIFLRLNQYRPPCDISTKFDSTSFMFEAINFPVYIKELLVLIKFLTNSPTTQ